MTMTASLAAALTAAIPLSILCIYVLWRQKPEPKDPEHPTEKSDPEA